jgi:hypothetical protein
LNLEHFVVSLVCRIVSFDKWTIGHHKRADDPINEMQIERSTDDCDSKMCAVRDDASLMSNKVSICPRDITNIQTNLGHLAHDRPIMSDFRTTAGMSKQEPFTHLIAIAIPSREWVRRPAREQNFRRYNEH